MSDRRKNQVTQCLSNNLLTILTILGVLAGIVVGGILRVSSEEKWTRREVMYLAFPGELFLNMLKSLIIPLLVSSIVTAIGSLDLSLSRKIAVRAISYYATTTVCAVILGMILVVIIRPGVGNTADFTVNDSDEDVERAPRNVLTQDTLLDLIRNLFPPNIIQATLYQVRTEIIEPANNASIPKELWKMKTSYGGNTNVLGIVVFSIVFGITLGKMKETGKPLLTFFESLSVAMMTITNWVIWISPIGVLFLVAAKIMEIKSFEEIVGKLSWYFVTVLLGLFIHGFGTLSVIYLVATRTLPFRIIAKLSQVMATAFGTASSSATMPITIQCMDKMGVDPRVTRFVIPIGATINMDGTALYEAVAAIFIAQIRGRTITFGNLVAISVTATAASIGAAGIPQAGLVTMVMVLDTVGLPAEDVTMIIAVDWLLDRFRTTINVMCDALGAVLVDKLSKNDLKNDALGEPHELVEIIKATDNENNRH